MTIMDPQKLRPLFIGLIFYSIQCISGESSVSRKMSSLILSNARAGEECDIRKNVLLVDDPDPINQGRTFLQCRQAGRGMIGFWQRMLCPSGQKFYYEKQICDSAGSSIVKPKLITANPPPQAETPSHAILHQSCARGQLCAGGAICDIDTLRCECPRGTYAQEDSYECTVEAKMTAERPEIIRTAQQVLASPGSSCQNGESCTGGSVCSNDFFVCTCPQDTTDQGGYCVRKQQAPVTLGNRCNRYSVCLNDAVCLKGRCNCQEPLVRLADRCVEKFKKNVGPGESCELGQICVRASVCSTVTRRCMCPIGTTQSGNECVDNSVVPADRAGVGANCELNTDCIIGAYCNANTYPPTCQCLSTHVEEQTICYRIVYPGQSGCDFDTQCDSAYEGAQCVNSVCVCPQGMNAQGQTCRPGSGRMTSPPGGSCAALQQCTGGSLCRDGWCVCTDTTMIVTNGRCIPNRNSGGRGKVDPEVIENTLDWPEKVYPGEYCGPNAICVERSVCRSGICTCPVGEEVRQRQCIRIIESQTFPPPRPQNFQTALPIPNPMDPCSGENLPCAGGSICDGQICRCPRGTQLRDNFCVFVQAVISPPYGPCDQGQECGGFSVCDGAYCQCNSDSILLNSTCVLRQPPQSENNEIQPSPRVISVSQKFVGPDESCSNGEECTGGSMCDAHFKRCVCPPGLSAAGGTCRRPPPIQIMEGPKRVTSKPGGSCRDGQHCTSGSVCFQGTCLCPQGLAVGSDGTCQQLQSLQEINPTIDYSSEVAIDLNVPVGGFCISGDICDGNSQCINSVCQCPIESTLKNGVCQAQINKAQKTKVAPVVAAHPRQSCQNGERCIGSSVCQAGVCQCTPGHRLAGNTCVPAGPPVASPGDPCGSDRICIGGSFCDLSHYCVCPDGTQNDAGVCRLIFVPPPQNNTRARSKQTVPVCPLPENPGACQLPHCYCSKTGLEIPGGLSLHDTPQLVVLTFDDAVNGKTMPIYRKLFIDGNIRNPNGCNAKSTIYISHEWTNYDDVQWLNFEGHELAANSITHTSLKRKPVSRWLAEMDGVRQMMVKFANVNQEEVIGMRGPQLSSGGDAMFEMMNQLKFKWDNTLSANPEKSNMAYWPQTLDYQVAWDCAREDCPSRPFPGIWEVPLNQFFGYFVPELNSFKRASMMRAAMGNETADSILQFLRKNFERAYTQNRAPFVMTLNADFFNFIPGQGGLAAFQQFVSELQKKNDVWFVTMKQLIEWMENPTPASQMMHFLPVQCRKEGQSSRPGHRPPCSNPKECRYKTPDLPSGEHTFRICGECPAFYPWVNNPLGV